MPFRARLKKTFSRNSTAGSDGSSTTGSTQESNVYGPGEKMPPSKYRRPVQKEHKEKLEAFSFASAWRRKSNTSLYSPMGSRMPSRKNSAEPQQGRRSRSFVQKVPEGEIDDADLANVGLSRQHTHDRPPSRLHENGHLSPLAAKDFADPESQCSGLNPDTPFTPDELTLAMKRSNLAVPSS